MRRGLSAVVLFTTMLLTPSALVRAEERAALPREALETLRQLAIQDNGRTKPLDSFARETLQLITGSPRIGREDPVETVLSIMANPERWQQVPLVSIPFIPLREALGLDRTNTQISYNDLVATRKLMRMLPAIVQKQQREEKLSMLENETMDAFQRFVALSNLLEQKLHLVPPANPSERVWLPILQPDGYAPPRQEAIRGAWTGVITAVRTGEVEAVTRAAREAAEVLQHLNRAAYPPPWRLRLEVFYNRVAPFRVARWIYLLAIVGLLIHLTTSVPRLAPMGVPPPSATGLPRPPRTQSLGTGFPGSVVGMGALVIGFIMHGAGIAMRVILGGRPPVSNFFETTLWLPFVAVALALIFERIYRVRYVALAAAILAAITLLLSDHLPLDSSISPVVAVLHSNLWLTVHVLTIVASYGALGLAVVLAHLYGWRYLVRPSQPLVLASFETSLYRVTQVGVVLLAGGIMLGAVWANASWGRYWGWDPKETWALITLLWFLAILHGRFAGWLRGIGVALATIAGFFLLLMTYYGVSFYLVGLHSYAGGHAKPLPPLLIGYLIVEVAFLLVVGLSALSRLRRLS